MSNGSGSIVSGRGESRVELPAGIPLDRALLLEAWGGLLSRTFNIEGELTSRQGTEREDLGSSGWGRDRSHIIVPPGYSSLHITGDPTRKPGKWNLLISEPSAAPEIGIEAAGVGASRVFAYHGGPVQASVEFESQGCLAFYSFDGTQRRELLSRDTKFQGSVKIPGPGLIAVQSPVAPHWGSIPPWRITLQGK
ncbi:hypothetical protein [Streptomyces sp. SID1121]|uniref:hypothetical protein n=1 Tax=Streptomyces sp. SID1121 TaxID=3425888 RepID=UPI004056C767